MKPDKFKSRYGQLRTITEQSDGSFIIEGESRYYRCGADEKGEGLWMIDFEGGPFVCVGDDLIGNKNYGKVKRLEVLKEQKEGHFAVKIICE